MKARIIAAFIDGGALAALALGADELYDWWYWERVEQELPDGRISVIELPRNRPPNTRVEGRRFAVYWPGGLVNQIELDGPDGEVLTTWGEDGVVQRQQRLIDDEVETRESPPWWNGAEDQRRP